MADSMTFPATFNEFAERYKIVDSKEVYTNGTELIPIFRVKQWLEDRPTAYVKEVKRGHWVESSNQLNKYCSECKKVNGTIYHKPPFCPHCGADMRGDTDGINR